MKPVTSQPPIVRKVLHAILLMGASILFSGCPGLTTPFIESVSPVFGPAGQVIQVTLSGHDLDCPPESDNTTVDIMFAGGLLQPDDIIGNSSTAIVVRVTVPATPGIYPFTVTTHNETTEGSIAKTSNAGFFRATAPSQRTPMLTSVSPKVFLNPTPQTLEVGGADLEEGDIVEVDGGTGTIAASTLTAGGDSGFQSELTLDDGTPT